MIGLKVNGYWIDLSGQKIGLEIVSPLFTYGNIPGILTYPFKVDLRSRNNRLALGWPDRLAVLDKPETHYNVELYLFGTLYKVGVLKYRGQKDLQASYNFQSDAADFNAQSESVKLRDLDLGVIGYSGAVVNGFYPDFNFAQFPVRNEKFYGDKNANFINYLNYYSDGSFTNNTLANSHVRVPYPYLLHVLKKVLAVYGYSLAGGWQTDGDIKKVVIINNYALDRLEDGINTFENEITLRNHLPDMTIGEFVVSLKSLFGLDVLFNSQLKTVTINTIDSAIAQAYTGPYVDWTEKASGSYEDSPQDYRGFSLKMDQDGTDDLMEEIGNDWLEYRVDEGKESIGTKASPLHMVTETDGMDIDRTWTIPVMKQAGSSSEFDLGVNYHPMRLMYYRGIKNQYPNGSYEGDDLDLRWQGAKGLYEKCWKNWLDFIKKGLPVDRSVWLNMADISELDHRVPVMIDHLKFMWSSIRLNVSDKGIGKASVKMMKL